MIVVAKRAIIYLSRVSFWGGRNPLSTKMILKELILSRTGPLLQIEKLFILDIKLEKISFFAEFKIIKWPLKGVLKP